MRGLIDDAFTHALEVLRTQRQNLDAAAAALLEKETLVEHELKAFLGRPPKPSSTVTPLRA